MKKRLLLTLSVLLLGLQVVLAQTGTIRGRILDDKGEGVPGATIRVKGTNKGVITDMNGNFKLNTEEGANLSISAIGMKTAEKTAQDGMSVKMAVDEKMFRETVVTAQAIKREKASLGYATSTLNNDEINKGNNVSALGALQGKVSGVNITSTTGGPGGSTRVVIRGEKSITGNNNALIVVDGIPINNSSRIQSDALKQIDFGNRGNDINPDDIESVSVLKGAAATVLYGSAGANGAIMITTKSGKAKSSKGSKAEVSFSTGNTWSRVLKLPTFQNQYGEGDLHATFDDRRENFSWGLPFDNQLRPWGQIINGQQQVKKYSAIEDNVKNFYNTGKAWENNLGISGATEKSSYYFSFNSLNSKGVIPNNFYNKYSFRLNATHEFSNSVFASANLNYINGASRTDQGGQGDGSVMNNVSQQPRDIPINNLKDLDNVFNSMDYTDTTGVRRYGYYGAYTQNPYWVAKNYDNRNKFDRMIGQTTIGAHLNQHFTISNRFGGEVLSDRNYFKTPKINTIAFEDFWAASPKSNNGGYAESSNSLLNYNNDVMLTGNFQIAKLGITTLVGQSVESKRTNALSSEIDPNTNGLVIENFYNFGNAKSKILSANSLNLKRKVGAYAQVSFDFDKFFFFDLTARNDWSSALVKENRSYFYPSASASWLFSHHFSDAVKKVFNYGKLRANVTSVGNDPSEYDNNNPGFVSTNIAGGYGNNTIFPFVGVPGFSYQSTIGNPDLKPERQIGKEVGIELAFFEDRITADFTVYSSLQKDQILLVPTAPSSGFTGKFVNLGEVQNKGFETRLQISPIKRKGFRWDIYGTYTRNKNKVLSLPNGVDQVVIGGFSGMSVVAAVGKPIGTFYATALATDGAGHQIIDSTTGNPVSTTKPVYLGSFQPKFQASWGTNLSYKGFNVSILFDTKQGGYFYSRTKDNLEFVGVTPSTTINNRQPFLWDNSVYKNAAGDYVSNTTSLTDPYYYYTSAGVKAPSENLVKAGYIKLREVSIGYKLPQKWFAHTYIGSGSFSIFGSNLAIWTNKGNDYVDPEMNSGGASNLQGFDYSASPSVKNFGFKLGLTF